MSEPEDIRAAKVLAQARQIFSTDHPDTAWPSATDLSHDDQLMRVQAHYLQRAEQQLLKDGVIESVDQS